MILRILSTTVYVNTANTIKKIEIGQILDVTNNTVYILFFKSIKFLSFFFSF